MGSKHLVHRALSRRLLQEKIDGAKADGKAAVRPSQVLKSTLKLDILLSAKSAREVIVPLTRATDFFLGTHGNPWAATRACMDPDEAEGGSITSVSDLLLAVPTFLIVPWLATYPAAQALCLAGAAPKALGSGLGAVMGAAAGLPHGVYLAAQRKHRLDLGAALDDWLATGRGDAVAKSLKVPVESLEDLRPLLTVFESQLDRARVAVRVSRAPTRIRAVVANAIALGLEYVEPDARVNVIRQLSSCSEDELSALRTMAAQFCDCDVRRMARKITTLVSAAADERSIVFDKLLDTHDLMRLAGRQTDVGAAIACGAFDAAAGLIARGASADLHDRAALRALSAQPHTVPVFAALLLQRLISPEALPSDMSAQDLRGYTLVMHVGADATLVRDLVQRGYPVFPDEAVLVNTHAVSQPMIAAVVRSLLPDTHAFKTLPQLLRNRLCEQAIQGVDLKLAEACIRGGEFPQPSIDVLKFLVGATSQGVDGVDVAKLVTKNTSFDAWASLAYETMTFTGGAQACLERAGFSPALLARCTAVRTPADWSPPPPPAQDTPRGLWLRQVAPRDPKYCVVTTERNTTQAPAPFFQDEGVELLRGGIIVGFAGEDPAHGTGATKDWLAQMVDHWLRPRGGLFEPCAEASRLQIKPHAATESLQEYRFAGRLLAKTLVLGYPTGIKLGHGLLKMMVGKEPGLEELARQDPRVAQSLRQLRELDVESLELCFETSGLRPHEAGRDVPLVPGGAERKVTAENLEEYIRLKVQYLLVDASAGPAHAFLAGVNDLLPHSILSKLSVEELDRLIAGEDRIDVDEWESHTLITDGTPLFVDGQAVAGKFSPLAGGADTPVVRMFWEWVRQNPDKQTALLQVVTGMAGSPAGGFASLDPPFTLNLMNDPSFATVARTCLNVVDLPRYTSQERVDAMLDYLLSCKDVYNLA